MRNSRSEAKSFKNLYLKNCILISYNVDAYSKYVLNILEWKGLWFIVYFAVLSFMTTPSFEYVEFIKQ